MLVRRMICALFVVMFAVLFSCLGGRDAAAVVFDSFDVGDINSPDGYLDSAEHGTGRNFRTARDLDTGVAGSEVLGGIRAIVVGENSFESDQSSSATLNQTDAGDGYLELLVGAGGTGLVSYTKPDRSSLLDLFGSGKYSAFQFEFLEGTDAGRLTISLRGDFPEGGNQIFARVPIEGPGQVQVPFSLIEGEFGGPPGRLGQPWEFFFLVSPPVNASQDAEYRYLISQVGVVPEPASFTLVTLLVVSCFAGRGPSRLSC